MTRQRPLIVGLSAGTLALGADYLAHAFFTIPLLPEQAGYIMLKLLPLSTFASLLKTLGVTARPLLLVGATVVIIAVYGVAAVLIARLYPRGYVPILTVLAALTSAIFATVAFSPSDSPIGAVVEVVLLAGMVPLVDRVVRGLATPGPVNEDRRILLRNIFYGAVGIALLGIGYANVRRFATALAMKEGSRSPAEVTAVSDFYVVSKNLAGDPVVNAASWRLNLPGRSLSYEELLALPSRQLELTLECISNEIGGTLISNGIWKGPQVSDVLALTPPPSNATWMLMESADGYTESF
ncbi:MAG TPA: molybdopterin-dependent oxidoreductase, partial [Candidatus Binatus sp.]|nr:molybdopterin-dependent oxidoreductase [Candidatus Binatus sp.]